MTGGEETEGGVEAGEESRGGGALDQGFWKGPGGLPPEVGLPPHASSHQWALLAIAYVDSG